MKKLSKSQISLLDTLESIIHSDYFHHLMTQETIPPSIKLLSFKNIDGEEVLQSTLVAPPIDDLTLEEKEILFFLSQRIGGINFNLESSRFLLYTTKEDFLNFLGYIIREVRFS